MINLIIGAVLGAVVFGLVLRKNPNIGKWLGVIVDKIEDELDNKK